MQHPLETKSASQRLQVVVLVIPPMFAFGEEARQQLEDAGYPVKDDFLSSDYKVHAMQWTCGDCMPMMLPRALPLGTVYSGGCYCLWCDAGCSPMLCCTRRWRAQWITCR